MTLLCNDNKVLFYYVHMFFIREKAAELGNTCVLKVRLCEAAWECYFLLDFSHCSWGLSIICDVRWLSESVRVRSGGGIKVSRCNSRLPVSDRRAVEVNANLSTSPPLSFFFLSSSFAVSLSLSLIYMKSWCSRKVFIFLLFIHSSLTHACFQLAQTHSWNARLSLFCVCAHCPPKLSWWEAKRERERVVRRI